MIGVDPYYLVHKAESTGVPTQLILAGRNLNDGMSTYVASELSSLFQARSLELKGASVLVLGVTFKENCGDVRNSKVFDLCNSLSMMGIDINMRSIRGQKYIGNQFRTFTSYTI